MNDFSSTPKLPLILTAVAMIGGLALIAAAVVFLVLPAPEAPEPTPTLSLPTHAVLIASNTPEPTLVASPTPTVPPASPTGAATATSEATATKAPKATKVAATNPPQKQPTKT